MKYPLHTRAYSCNWQILRITVYLLLPGAESKRGSRTCLYQLSLRFFRQEFRLQGDYHRITWETKICTCAFEECKTRHFCCSVILCCKYIFACFPPTVWSSRHTAFYFASKPLKMGGVWYLSL